MKNLAKTLIYILLGTGLAYLSLKYIAPVFLPFIIALFLTFFIEPLVDLIQTKSRLPRQVAVGIAMLITFGGVGLLITAIVTRLIVELVHLSAFLPEYINDIKSVIVSLQGRAEAYYLALPPDVIDFINERVTNTEFGLDSILSRAEKITGTIINVLLGLVSSVPGWIILIIISGIATYFMAKDKRILLNFWLRVMPEPWGRKVLDIVEDIFNAVISYIRAQMVLITLTFIQTLIGLYIIGAPYALLMGLVIGFADIIPVLGPSAIYLPWIIWEFITGDTIFAIKLTVLYAIVIIVRQVMETKIVSSTMGLHPLATLVSMYVGLKLLGPLGVVTGPVFLITLKACVSAGLIGWKQD